MGTGLLGVLLDTPTVYIHGILWIRQECIRAMHFYLDDLLNMLGVDGTLASFFPRAKSRAYDRTQF
jgi:hypothetical protein